MIGGPKWGLGSPEKFLGAKNWKIAIGAYSSQLITPEWKRIFERLKRLWSRKRMAVAGVLLFYYIVRRVSWWRLVFIVVLVSSCCAVMWIGLYCCSRQLIVCVRIQFARWPPALFAYVWDNEHAVDREVSRFVCEAEVVQSSFRRCILTTIVNRRVVSVLCAGSGYGGSSFRLFMRFEQSRKLST